MSTIEILIPKLDLKITENNKQLLNYISKTGDLLVDYCNGNRSKDLIHQYLMLTDIAYRIKHSKFQMNINCEQCKISRLFIPEESRYVCETCGETEYILSNLANYSEKPRFKKYSPYTRITYLKETLARLQAKEPKPIPNTIIDLIKNQLFKAKIKTDNCTTKHILEIMKKHNLQKYYPHIQQVYCTITRCQPISISQQTEKQIIQMFKQIEQVFDKQYPNNAKFLSYSYVLNKLFHMLHMPQIANCFPLLKHRDKLINHDEKFKEICKQLGWDFIKSL